MEDKTYQKEPLFARIAYAVFSILFPPMLVFSGVALIFKKISLLCLSKNRLQLVAQGGILRPVCTLSEVKRLDSSGFIKYQVGRSIHGFQSEPASVARNRNALFHLLPEEFDYWGVYHTSRFETTNLNKAQCQAFLNNRAEQDSRRLILLALTPGLPESTAPAERRCTIGDKEYEVVTLYLAEGNDLWQVEHNRQAIVSLHKMAGKTDGDAQNYCLTREHHLKTRTQNG